MTHPLRIVLAALAALAFSLNLSAAPKVGTPAPDFTLTDLHGTKHSLSDYRGKIVVLEWVNPECPIVKKHYERSGNIPGTQQAAVADGVVWLAINSGHAGAQGDFDPAQVAAWQKKTGAAQSSYFRDQTGKVGKLYDARHTPTMYVVDAAGTLVYAGGIDDINSGNPADIAKATNLVKATLSDLKAGRPVARATSPAYGCSVKY